MAATNWRAIRTRIRERGLIAMALPSLHDVLDEAEDLWVESRARDDDGLKPEQRIKSLYNELYAPDLTPSGVERLPVPAGFEGDAVEDAFDRFAKSAGSRG